MGFSIFLLFLILAKKKKKKKINFSPEKRAITQASASKA
jgi:hypothetical protein